MTETIFAVIGAIAIAAALGAILVQLRRILSFSGKIRELRSEIETVKFLANAIEHRTEDLEEKREFNTAREIDALARKVNALSNYGRTLELTGVKVDDLSRKVKEIPSGIGARITLLETRIPPAPQIPAQVTGTDEGSSR